jgi:hypothetical protein
MRPSLDAWGAPTKPCTAWFCPAKPGFRHEAPEMRPIFLKNLRNVKLPTLAGKYLTKSGISFITADKQGRYNGKNN